MEDKYFSVAGDLVDEMPVEDKGFKPAGDLDDGLIRPLRETSNINENIEKININNSDKLDDYLLSVVSGKKYGNVCELGILVGSGRIIVDVRELMQMVSEGYNIVSASVIGPNMIEIEFQKYVYDEEKMERWRRF